MLRFHPFKSPNRGEDFLSASSIEPNTKWHWFIDIVLLTLLIGSAFAFMLGSRPLNVPDEARYSEIAREMLVTHDFITPKINGIKYFEKPPLFYWMQAGSLKTFGMSEWACRLMDALMALLGCLATYFTTRILFDRKTGLFSTIILSTSLLYFALARVITLDMTVSIWLCLSLYSFILGVYKSKSYFYLLYIFAALAVLTKGLIGIIFPGSIIFIWMLLTWNWKILKECHFLKGLILFLLITLPWHILVQIKNPEFFHFYFIDQQFTRYLTLEAHRYQPDWYYIPIVLLGLFPWTGFLIGAIKNIKWRDQKTLFFVLSALFILAFFSFSKSKLVPYVLPCMPFFAILIGDYFANNNKENSKYIDWIGFIITSIISLSIIIAFPFYLSPDVTTNYIEAKKWACILSAVLLLNTIIIPWIFYKKGFLTAVIAQIIVSALFLFSLCATAPYVYMGSIKTMALQLKSVLKPGDIVATYDYYYQDLPFYLNQTITIVNWHGELDFGSHYAHDKNLMIRDNTFWPLWQSQQRVYMMTPKDLLKDIQKRFPQDHFYVKSETKNDVLVVNHEDK